MICDSCKKNVNSAFARYCARCGKVFCPMCDDGICDCFGQLSFFN